MDLQPLFAATDAEPFRPFQIELQSGRVLDVNHPENIFYLPNRQRVDHIEVFQTDTGEWALFFPEALNAVLRNGEKSSSGRS